MHHHTTEEIISDFAAGKLVVLMDDESRENEGDLIMPAEKATPEAINFMARYGRGLICMPITRERCAQLGLKLMVTENREAHRTQFTTSIDAASGVSTGISAADRATTILAAVHSDAKALRSGAAGARLPSHGGARRGAHARRSHRGRLRPRPARRTGTGRGAGGDPQRRRHDGEAPRTRSLRSRARTQARDHRRPHTLPDDDREDGAPRR